MWTFVTSQLQNNKKWILKFILGLKEWVERKESFFGDITVIKYIVWEAKYVYATLHARVVYLILYTIYKSFSFYHLSSTSTIVNVSLMQILFIDRTFEC